MSHNNPTVFIADDDIDLINVLRERCAALQLDVLVATDASKAWRGIEQAVPDAVILDVNMPCGDGLSVREMMAHHEQLKTIPVIMITGMQNEDTIRRCHDSAAYYVTKCADVWPRIEPILKDVLHLGHRQTEAPCEETFRGPTELMDAVFAALACDDTIGECDLESLSPAQFEKPWVLCVDDDATFSRGLKLRLEKYGVEVVRAFAGMEGYRKACTGPAQAIILDYEMPDGNGAYVLRRLKESPVTQDIPVIVLTGRHDKWLERQMYGLGATCFMTKPYVWARLWQELQRHLTLPAVAADKV